ncbi:MAG: 16S rRNA (guanine(966)-N(2))-methyltransferase RsmD [Firmicutes bacterium]|nr:16S rRNA (guanine(966)-N(2))-methyltransferase RsmD [Bacillota bacterium]
MRVIGGKYRGRSLKSPKYEGVRPTADRVKEALFNILGARIQGAAFLDLFAGAGGIGIEAISRGAARVVFADQSLQSVKLIKQNLNILEPDEPVRVLNLSFGRTIDLLAKEKYLFDLVFLDPPFEGGILTQAIQGICTKNLLKADGLIIAEHPSKYKLIFPEFEGKTRNYGDIGLTFLNKR